MEREVILAADREGVSFISQNESESVCEAILEAGRERISVAHIFFSNT